MEGQPFRSYDGGKVAIRRGSFDYGHSGSEGCHNGGHLVDAAFELFRMQTSGIIYNIGLITLATDCIIGFFITFQGRHINMGINPKLAIRLFEEGAFDKFHSSMIFKKYTALRDLSSTLERINLLIIVQFFLTGIGFISVILMEVRNVI